MNKTYAYSDILGWSASRFDTFEWCKRKYYYAYYAKYDTEFNRAQITKLKLLTSVALETGIIVHEVIANLLKRIQKSNHPLDMDRLRNHISSVVHAALQQKTFSEVYYGETNSVSLEEINQAVTEAIFNFVNSERMEWIMSKTQADRAKWIIEPSGYGETRIAGHKAYCKVDFLLPDPSGLTYI